MIQSLKLMKRINQEKPVLRRYKPNVITTFIAGQEKNHMCFWPLNMHFAKIRSCYITGFALNMFRGQRHVGGFSAQ